MCDIRKSWYLAQCKPRQDERAEHHLLRQGYSCYRPTILVDAVSRGKRKAVVASLFPGYIFVHLGQDEDWGPLRSTRGVLRIVRFGKHPTPVPDQLIGQLRDYDKAQSAGSLFISGERVRITHGAFAEIEAIFLAMDGDERVVLLMNMLKRDHKVLVSIDHVRKA